MNRHAIRAPYRQERGFALLTALVLLFTLTIVGVAAMMSTSLEYRQSANTAFLARARETSESARMAATSVLPEHTYQRGWNGITLLPGLTVRDKDGDGHPDNLYGSNDEGSPLDDSNPAALTTDMDYSVFADANGDGDTSDPVDVFRAEIKVYHTATRFDQGSGAAHVAGYEGLGKGAAAGGTVIYYYAAAEGFGPGNARAWTSADSRARVFN
jgi:hypothetical protein